MKEQTEANMKAAFAGESQAHMKYMNFSDKADREGKPNIARLFKAVSFAEKIHASSHLKALGQIGSTEENLKAALAGETYEVNEMYPAFLKAAQEEGEKVAGRSMDWALASEKTHAALYDTAIKAAGKGEDMAVGVISVCGVCGYTVEGEPPDKCPVCGALKDKFVGF